MTTRTADEVAKRTRSQKPQTFEAAILERLLADIAAESSLHWPSARYRADPVAFFREVLGVEPWSKQVEIIEAVRDHKRVAVSSGHKVSKSHSDAGIALWFYCSFPDARVVMSSVTSRQVDQILWRELRMMTARAGRCSVCKLEDEAAGRTITEVCPHSAKIDGDLHELARSGLKSSDFREIVGFTAREAEAVAGISGKNLLYILDEASGIPDIIFEAIEGNRAGGARVLMTSNPTRTEGEFFEAFDKKKAFYKTIRVSSEDTPNVKEGRIVIPGLATREWIEEKKAEWGVDSALYKVRVEGKFVLKEDGKIISLHRISQAEIQWHVTSGEGLLYIGIDPAGEGGQGDESVFSVRRGYKQLALHCFRGLTEEDHVAHLRGFLAQHRVTDEVPVVVIDREGSIGVKLWRLLCAIREESPGLFQLIGVRSSDAAQREPLIYDRMRDELWANLERWMREGGAIVEDTKLERELHAPSWFTNIKSRLKATAKDDIRKAIGRSPDRADALALSVWELPSVRDEAPAEQPKHESHQTTEQALDPYAGAYFWESPGGAM